jgi:hypothetical protein
MAEMLVALYHEQGQVEKMKGVQGVDSLLHDERKGCKEWIVYSRRGKKGISNVNE